MDSEVTLQLQHGRLQAFSIDFQYDRAFSVGVGADYYGQLAGEEVHVREMEKFERARVTVGDGTELAGTGH